MSIHLGVGSQQRASDAAPDTQWLDNVPNEEVRRVSKPFGTPGPSRRFALSLFAFLALAFLNFGCNREAKPAGEKVPPAPIKWEEARQLFLEEWTELVGSTQPLPDHAARVTSPVAGRVVAVLPNGYDLRLTFAVKDVADLPTAGKNLIVVATIKNVLHFRIFDRAGKIVVDTDETKLPAKVGPIADLKKQLEKLWPPHKLTEEETDRVITAATSIVGHTPPNRADTSIVEGQLVEEGDVLIRLDATAVLANLGKAEAAKKVLLAEREVAAVAVKQAALDVKALEELKRKQDTQTQLVSPILLDKAVLALESAQASVRALDYKIEAADKDVVALNLDAQLYVLTAPRKGRLGRLKVVLGQTLPAGAVVAEVLGIEDEIDVLCFVSATDVRKFQVGQQARIGGFEKDPATEASADPEGKVAYVADEGETETGLFAVKVRFPNRDLKLRSGSVARVRILTKPGKACWAIPESALMEDQDPPGIVVVEDVATVKNAEGKDEQIGKARRLRAVIGMRDRVLHQVEILRLEDVEKKWRGDLEHALIVIEKGQGLQTGDAVKLDQEEEEEPAKPDPKP